MAKLGSNGFEKEQQEIADPKKKFTGNGDDDEIVKVTQASRFKYWTI